MQSELNVAADKTLQLVERNRKTGSCPLLFTWNGDRFECLGDFAGAAGLGFLEAPGEYHPPDRDEAMAIRPEQLREIDGRYRLSVVEPMDEVAYLDHLTLDVVDQPPGRRRPARGAVRDSAIPVPSGDLFAWTRIDPRRWPPRISTGSSVLPGTRTGRSTDRGRLRSHPGLGWVHRGPCPHPRLRRPIGRAPSRQRAGPLPLTGWVEYPYSQTNYAAASCRRRPPSARTGATVIGWELAGDRCGDGPSRRPDPDHDREPGGQAPRRVRGPTFRIATEHGVLLGPRLRRPPQPGRCSGAVRVTTLPGGRGPSA